MLIMPTTIKIELNYIKEKAQESKDRNPYPIKDIKEYNNDANPVVLWSLIKGAIRNETIAYSSRQHKIEEEKIRKFEREISNLEQRISQINKENNSINYYNNNNNNNNSNNNNNIIDQDTLQTDELNIARDLKKKKKKKEELDEIYGNKANGILTRLKMTHLQVSKNLEKQKAESKIINKLTINGKQFLIKLIFLMNR